MPKGGQPTKAVTSRPVTALQTVSFLGVGSSERIAPGPAAHAVGTDLVPAGLDFQGEPFSAFLEQ